MFGRYIERYLLVWLVVLSGVALFWNHFRTHADRNRAGPLVVRRKSRVTLFFEDRAPFFARPGLRCPQFQAANASCVVECADADVAPIKRRVPR